ncbi:MAG TPA: DUF433 domain-containing protein [Phormidium sp.]
MSQNASQAVSRYVTRHPEILQGEPIIVGTRTSVRAIVELWRLGITPEEIPMHLPHLKLVQIFDALSFYLDNEEEINTALLNQGMKKITLKSKSFVDTGFYDGHI